MENLLSSFVIANNEKCTGCRACEVACFASHNKDKVSHTVGSVSVPITPRLYLVRLEDTCMPIQCKQCEDAPCMGSCSASAITKVDGVMMVNEKLCYGCKTCMMACPFGAIELLPHTNGQETKILAYKCDRCIEDSEPACIKACPHEALRFVNPNEEAKDKKIKAAMALRLTV